MEENSHSMLSPSQKKIRNSTHARNAKSLRFCVSCARNAQLNRTEGKDLVAHEPARAQTRAQGAQVGG